MNVTKEQLYIDGLEILKEDVEWWKKRRKRDKKNLRILIGHGKGPKGKHVKKGAPFTKDPPRYAGTKGSPGLGLLEQQKQPIGLSQLIDLAQPGDVFKFKFIKDFCVKTFEQSPVPCTPGPHNVKVFAAGGTYAGIAIEGDKFKVKTAKGFHIEKTKKELKGALGRGNPEQFIDFSQSTATRGQATFTLAQLQTGASILTGPKPAVPGTAAPGAAPGGVPVKPEIKKDTTLSDKQQKSVVSGLLDKHAPTLGKYTNRVSDWFAKNPYIQTLSQIIDSLWQFLKNVFAGLGIGKAIDNLVKYFGGLSIGQGDGQTAVLFGDSQMSPGFMGNAYKKIFTNSGYKVVLLPAGGKNVSYFLGGSDKAKKLEEELKKKPAYVVFHGGGNSSVAGATKSTQQIVEKIRQLSGPQTKIVWSGPPPFVMKRTGRVNPAAVPGGSRDGKRRQMNENMKQIIRNASNAIFFNPYELMKSYYTESSDGYHVPAKIAEIYVKQIFTGGAAIAAVRKGAVKLKTGRGQVANIVVEEAKKANVDSRLALTIARIESGLNPLSNINKSTQYKGLYQFGKNYMSEWAKYGLEWDKVHNARHNAAAFMGAITAKINSLRTAGIISKSTAANVDPSEAHLIYLSWQQGTSGIKTIVRAARTGAAVSSKIQGNMAANTYPKTPDITPEAFLDMWKGKLRSFGAGTERRYAKLMTPITTA